jgi:hypothetical protein
MPTGGVSQRMPRHSTMAQLSGRTTMGRAQADNRAQDNSGNTNL